MTRGEWDALQEQYDAFAEALAVSASGLDLGAHKAMRQASEQLERVGKLIAIAAGFDDSRSTLPGDEAVRYAHDAAFVRQHPKFLKMERHDGQWFIHFANGVRVIGSTPQEVTALARQMIEARDAKEDVHEQ